MDLTILTKPVGSTNQQGMLAGWRRGIMIFTMKIPVAALVTGMLGVLGAVRARGESFENVPVGPVSVLETSVGRWRAEAGQAEIIGTRGHSGSRSIRLGAKGDARIVLELERSAAAGCRLSLFAERWTKRPPFAFTVEAMVGDAWQEIHHAAADEVKVGGFLTEIRVPLPGGASKLRFFCGSGVDGGILLDDVMISVPGPMAATGVALSQPVCPAMIRAAFNPVLGICVTVTGSVGTLKLEAVELDLAGTTRPTDIERLEVFAGSPEPLEKGTERIAETTRPGGKIALACNRDLSPGDNWFWVSPALKAGASIDGLIGVSLVRVKAGGKMLEPAKDISVRPQRIGYAIRLPGDDKSKAYRIPGLARGKTGTLIAVYDIRYAHAGDLPADIDIGVSRSTDGGQSWSPMRVALDMGKDPKYAFDGVGDPCVMVDDVNGRIWIAASWSHGKLGWNGSKPGLEPEQTHQFMMTWSDDDGRTWAKPRNLTKELKNPAWRLFLQGPGAGITMKDGTLVMPAQFRAANGEPDQGKPFSTVIWSKDHGANWHVGSGVKIDTTEAQVAELADGSLMINCRDNRGGSRTIAVTRDLGQTWTPHPTDRKALREPVCMASLLRWQHPGDGELMFFSNPDTTNGRHHMTVKLSRDQTLTWPDADARLYDSRPCFGYSCLAVADATHLGVLYEGSGSIQFLRLSLGEWIK